MAIRKAWDFLYPGDIRDSLYEQLDQHLQEILSPENHGIYWMRFYRFTQELAV